MSKWIHPKEFWLISALNQSLENASHHEMCTVTKCVHFLKMKLSNTCLLLFLQIICYQCEDYHQSLSIWNIDEKQEFDCSEQGFSGKTNEWVTMVTVSKWYDELFLNWWAWYNNLELNMDIIMIAEDLVTYDKYKNEECLKVFYFESNEVGIF